MNKKQEEEWHEAQKILIGEDLVAVAQRQLEFLAAVDRQRWLYNSRGLDRAIYRCVLLLIPFCKMLVTLIRRKQSNNIVSILA